MNPIKQAMPALARHEGVWEGIYRYLDAEGRLIDEHRSRLVCRFPDDGPYPYHQSNHYTWADGRTESRDYPAQFRDGRLAWDNPRIAGWAIEPGADEQHGTLLLCWTRKDSPGSVIWEMVQISPCGRFRSRVWQWLEDGRPKMRALIDEERINVDWREA